MADERRLSNQFDLVQSPITTKDGSLIYVSKNVNLKTGEPIVGSVQTAIPDAASFSKRLIVDDKPLGRPLSKDRQEIIRFIRAYQLREGTLPSRIVIQRYDPSTGAPVLTELYSPDKFLPRTVTLVPKTFSGE